MIIHLDLDSFFASAERTRNLSLVGKPLIIGGRGDPFIFDPKPARAKRLITLNSGAFVPSLYHAAHDPKNYFFEGDRIRGIVTTASYEARRCGVKTAMSIREALGLCPQAILLPPDHLLYHTLSHRLMELLQEEIPLVEQYSIDEMFGDLRGWVEDRDLLSFMAALQRRIAEELLLPISIGAARSKWIAKLATSTCKPYGLRIVCDEELYDFVRDIPIDAFPGVGRAFGRRFEAYKIKTIGEALRAKSLIEGWGRQGRDLYAKLSGNDHEDVHPSRSRKGIGISRSMDHPIKDREEFYRRVAVMVRHWAHTIMRLGVNPTTFYFGIGYEHHYRSKKQFTTYRLINEPFLQSFAKEKFEELDIYPTLSIVSIAMSATKFLHHDPKTLDLLHYEKDQKMSALSKSLAKAREWYGMDIVRSGRELL
ncbi:MAG: DNA polymerase IV [Campylobacterales bacterium]|nr:DNA polymerase IV [Campylobacterales bacterium]